MALRANDGDAMQLAHYARILDAHGHRADTPFGGIIGKEEKVVWYDLDAPMFQTRSTSDPKKKTAVRSAFERYDHEFDFRLRVMHTAAGATDVGDPELLVPLNCSECPTCPWRSYCGERLDAGSGHVTLLPGIGYKTWLALNAADIETRQDLIDKVGLPAAILLGVFSEKGLGNLLDKAATAAPGDDIVALTQANATKQHAALDEAGVLTVADLLEIFSNKPILNSRRLWPKP